MNWIIENWHTIYQILSGVVFVGSLVAKLTPTAADDTAWEKVRAFLLTISLNSKA